MADITTVELIKLEKLFRMELGYVLDFSNSSLHSFVALHIGVDIYQEMYSDYGTSKAKRLKSLWNKASNPTTGKLVLELCYYWRAKRLANYDEISKVEEELYEECLKIGYRLQDDTIVSNIEILQSDDSLDSNLLIKQIKNCIHNNEPEAALDRTHTYLMKRFRQLCLQHELSVDKNEPLHSLYGKYIKHLQKKQVLSSLTTLQILKSGTSYMTTFSDVRNHQSFAHDNTLLNYEESVFVLNSITNILRLIEAIENKHFSMASVTKEDLFL